MSLTDLDSKVVDDQQLHDETPLDPDEEFGGTENRLMIEKRLLRKLDLRVSILVVIYILNYVRDTALDMKDAFTDDRLRSTATMCREWALPLQEYDILTSRVQSRTS